MGRKKIKIATGKYIRCKIAGCPKGSKHHNTPFGPLCHTHYERMRRHGDPNHCTRPRRGRHPLLKGRV